MNYSNHDCRLRTKSSPAPQPIPRTQPATAAKKQPGSRRRMKVSTTLMTAAASWVFLAPIADAQVVLQPNEAQSKDAKVYSFLPTMNFQSDLGVVGSGVTHSFKSLLQFDLAAVPIPAGEITLATLELYCSAITPITDVPDSGPGNVSIFQATATWTETGVTWNTFPALATTAEDTLFIGEAGRWFTFDVTSLVQDWQSGVTPNHGFAIIMDSPFGQVSFLDADGLAGANPDPTLAPRLTVVPEPGSAALVFLGGTLLGLRRRTGRGA